MPRRLQSDRFVMQQALMLWFLTREPFAMVDSSSSQQPVADPFEVMTIEELRHRGAHRSSLALQFRAKHRNGYRLRLQMRSTEQSEQRIMEENLTRLVKRRSIPPWLETTEDDHGGHRKSSMQQTLRSDATIRKRPRDGYAEIAAFASVVADAGRDDDEFNTVYER